MTQGHSPFRQSALSMSLSRSRSASNNSRSRKSTSPIQAYRRLAAQQHQGPAEAAGFGGKSVTFKNSLVADTRRKGYSKYGPSGTASSHLQTEPALSPSASQQAIIYENTE